MHSSFKAFVLAIIFFSTACGSAEDRINQRATAAQSSKNTKNAAVHADPDGMAIFRQYCVTCHGADGKLALNGAKDLTISILTLEERINIITNGKKLMTPFNEILTPEEIKAVAEYTQTLAVQK